MGFIKKLISKIDFDDMKYILGIANRYRVSLVILIVAQIPLSAATIGLSFLLKNLIDTINGRYGGSVGSLVALSIFIVLSQALVKFFSARFSIKTSTNMGNNIQQELFSHLQQMEYKRLNNEHSGKWMTLMTSDISNVSSVISDLLPRLAGSIAIFVGAFAGAILLYPLFSLILILLIPVILIYNRFYGSKQKDMQILSQEKESSVRAYLQDALGVMNVIKVFGNYESWKAKLKSLQLERTEVIIKRYSLLTIIGAISSVSSYIMLIFLLFIGASMVKSGQTTFGTLIAFIQMVTMLSSSVKGVFSSSGNIINCLGSAHRLLEIFKIELEEQGEMPNIIAPVGVRFDRVTFSYNDEINVLQDVSFVIPAGGMVGIIGESGIGKTTIANLVVGLYQAKTGDIFFTHGEEEIKASAITRRLVSFVPQGNTLISGSIKENLLVGCNDASDFDLQEAIEKAELGELIKSLPMGINTIIGEKGALLSAGQVQRISIARALLKKAPILLLDEPSSCLDNECEISILATIKTRFPDTTKIIITHRHEALQYCDLTLVVDDLGVVKYNI